MAMKRTLSELEDQAQRGGYPSYKDMLYELYIAQELSIPQVGELCNTTEMRVKRHLRRFGIARRVRVRTTTRFVMTDTLLGEIVRDGIPAVAHRLGTNTMTLEKHARMFLARKRNQPLTP